MQPPLPHDASSTRRGVLAGFRVLDFSAMIAGPYCARWLSDMGAEVIKIESPDGDHMRTRAPVRDGWSSFFGHLNSGKRFVAMDLKNAEATRLAVALAQSADVVIEAFRPGVMARLGLGPETLRALNPRLVYCSISGFGQDSSASSMPAYGPVVHAASGYYMATAGYQDDPLRPPNSGIPMADMLTAIFAALSIQTALLDRERTGTGTVIDVNLMDAMMSVMPYEFQAAQFPLPNHRPLYKPLRALDGFVLVTPINTRNFENLCEAIGHAEWLKDPVLSTHEARFHNWAEFMRRVEGWTCERTAAECESILMAAGVPCSRYRQIDEVMRDAQFEERDSFATVSDGAGDYLATRLPFSLAGAKPAAGGSVGAIGRDTAAVLQSILGLSADVVAALTRDGVVTTPASNHASSPTH
jgi:crotonobetainyl-CoA:carnitine CoA-transferase CaiB-like acyl-CoA transferase